MTPPPATGSPARFLGRAFLAFAITVVLGLSGPCAPVVAAEPSSAGATPAPVVAILLSPFLTYDDLSPATTPALWSLAEQGAVGSVNAMTADPGGPTVAGGALTLSAGRWASAAPTGPADASSLPAQRAANARSRALPALGALGEAVHAAGGRSAAVGTSDPGTSTASAPLRPAELVACDAAGSIDFVATGNDLLVPDPQAPFGVSSDSAALSSAIASALADIATAPGRGGLLVVDPGDLSRAQAAHAATAADGRPAPLADRARALASLDAAAAALTRRLPPGSLLIVLPHATEKPYYEPPYFGPVIASGRGLKGLLTSASTHRPGLVTSLDVAPTVLGALGLPTPSPMIGSTLASTPDDTPLAEKLAALRRANDAAGAIDKLRDLYFAPSFVWFAIACVGVALVAAFLRADRLLSGGKGLLLLVLCAPPAAWLALFAARHPATPAAAGTAFGIAWLIAAGAAAVLARFVRPAALLAAVSGATAAVILADQWFAGPLESGLFSYSIRAGWRYYGIGNEGSALAVAAALVAVGLACDLAAGTRWAAPLRRYALPLAGAAVLVTAAAPFAGANAGVAVWGFFAFAAAWLRVNEVRFTPRTVGLTVAAMLLLVAALAAVDILGGGGGTHIGRFFLEAGREGSGAWELVRRKALNNLDYLSQTPYSWLAAAIVLAAGAERFARPRPLASALERVPAYRGALVGVIVGGFFALITEDSGIVMPALMLLAGALPAMYLALDGRQNASSDR